MIAALVLSSPINAYATTQSTPTHTTTRSCTRRRRRYKLAVLYDGTPASQQRQTSFKDFESATATTKAAKSKAKGFGAPAAAPAAAAAPQQRVSVELSANQLESVVSYNAFGSEVNDIGAAPARGEELASFIGAWRPAVSRQSTGAMVTVKQTPVCAVAAAQRFTASKSTPANPPRRRPPHRPPHRHLARVRPP